MPKVDAAPTAQQVAAQNMGTRDLILRSAVAMKTQIASVAVNPANNPILNINAQNVGLIRGFLVKVTGTLGNAGTAAAALTPFGAANTLSSINFTDLANTTRIATTGWHLSLINSAKHPQVFGGVYTPNVPVGYGNNFTVMSAPSSIAASGTGAISYYYYVPLAYSKTDLRGAMYGAVLNATSVLQLGLNTTPGVTTGDRTLAIYSGANTAVTWQGNVTVTVWQDYFDQLPRDQNQNVILPQLDLQQVYELKNTTYSALVQGQDFPMPFANYRTFLSTSVVFDNAGTLNTGSDVNYFAMRAANSTQLFQYGPSEVALHSRGVFAADTPAGVYYFDHRDRPINTANYGNMSLIINPSTVNAGAALLVGYEDLAAITQLSYASSLPGS